MAIQETTSPPATPRRPASSDRWRLVALGSAGCALILASIVARQGHQLRALEQRSRQQLASHEEYWQMRYATLQRISDAKDRARRIADAMEKDLRLGAGRAHVNAVLRLDGEQSQSSLDLD